MIEKIILDYLSKELPVPVYAEVPSKMPKSFVVVDKTGSGENDHIRTAMIAIQSYAESRLKAAELNEEVKTAMDAIVGLSSISKSKLNSDYNYTDTDTKQYRYQAVYDLVHF